MKSKVEGNKYLITDDQGRFPCKLNKKRVDKAIKTLKKDLSHFNKTIEDLYDKDYEVYHFIIDNCFWPSDFNDGKNYTLRAMENDLDAIQEFLSEDDEIPTYEEVVLLEDLGYEKEIAGPDGRWVKKIEDTDEKLVEEEIWPEIKLRRLMTVIWENVDDDFGCHKSSKEIIYKKLKMNKKLEKACENTLNGRDR